MKFVTLNEFKRLVDEMWTKVIEEPDTDRACSIRDTEMKLLMEHYEIIEE